MKYESVSEPDIPQKIDKAGVQEIELRIDQLVNSLQKYNMDDQTPPIQQKWIEVFGELENSGDRLSVERHLQTLIGQLEE